MSPKRPADMVLLTSARAGQWATVCAVHGGRGAADRLAHLGLLTGHRVRMVRPSRAGPVLVEVKGSRLALGQSLARRIRVRLMAIGPASETGPEPLAIPAE